MKLPELKTLMKEYKIQGSSYVNKPEMIAKLVEKGLLSELPTKERKPKTTNSKSTNPKYEWLKGIRVNPRQVTIRDLETGEIKTYNSIYKASRDLGRSSHYIVVKNGKVLDGRYEVTVGESPQVPPGEAQQE